MVFNRWNSNYLVIRAIYENQILLTRNNGSPYGPDYWGFPAGIGGFKKLMDILNGSRIGIAAQGVGLAQAAYDVSVSYAKQRTAFGGKLSEFQSIQWMIADMATEIEASRMLVYKAAGYKDEGVKYAKEASMAKLLSSKVAVESANKAVQIHGGLGYFSPTVAERLYRDSKVTEIYEGTSEIQRMIIAKECLK